MFIVTQITKKAIHSATKAAGVLVCSRKKTEKENIFCGGFGSNISTKNHEDNS